MVGFTERPTMIRDDIKAAQIAAMKARDNRHRGATRLIQSAIKNRDIDCAPSSSTPDDDDCIGGRSAAENDQAAPRIDRDVP
jgi:hypothetical protein